MCVKSYYIRQSGNNHFIEIKFRHFLCFLCFMTITREYNVSNVLLTSHYQIVGVLYSGNCYEMFEEEENIVIR